MPGRGWAEGARLVAGGMGIVLASKTRSCGKPFQPPPSLVTTLNKLPGLHRWSMLALIHCAIAAPISNNKVVLQCDIALESDYD